MAAVVEAVEAVLGVVGVVVGDATCPMTYVRWVHALLHDDTCMYRSNRVQSHT